MTLSFTVELPDLPHACTRMHSHTLFVAQTQCHCIFCITNNNIGSSCTNDSIQMWTSMTACIRCVCASALFQGVSALPVLLLRLPPGICISHTSIKVTRCSSIWLSWLLNNNIVIYRLRPRCGVPQGPTWPRGCIISPQHHSSSKSASCQVALGQGPVLPACVVQHPTLIHSQPQKMNWNEERKIWGKSVCVKQRWSKVRESKTEFVDFE